MRETRNAQPSIFESYAKHETGTELAMMSKILDQCDGILALAASDLIEADTANTGRSGLPVESVVRIGLLKQCRQLSYKELAFYLEDSLSYRSFARLPYGIAPRKSALQHTISRIQPSTWEHINQTLIQYALDQKLEETDRLRIDSTVVETDIHDPTDSQLLWDGIRMLTRRLMKASHDLKVPDIEFSDDRKAAKSLARQIIYTRGMAKKKPLYIDLLALAEEIMRASDKAAWLVNLYRFKGEKHSAWVTEVKVLRRGLRQVIRQTRRRVLRGESVPVADKLVSLHEPHSDIIVKGGRDTQYGHKLNVTSGRRGLILDATIESGNPSDIERYTPLLERHRDFYGAYPAEVAADGGYASQANLADAKAIGIREVAFQKKKGLLVEAMTSTHRVYEELCHFRAGIESNISELKRAYGLGRCLWRGLEGFKSCVWSAICGYNLVKIARLNTC